jgi:hypothetical protein
MNGTKKTLRGQPSSLICISHFFFKKKKALRGSLNKALRFATLWCAEPHTHHHRHIV